MDNKKATHLESPDFFRNLSHSSMWSKLPPFDYSSELKVLYNEAKRNAIRATF